MEEAADDVELQQQASADDDIAEVKRQSGLAPVVKMVNLVLQEAVKQGASDVHFEPRANRVDIRYRIDGALHPIRQMPKQLQGAVTSRIKIMADMDIAEKRRPQDGRMSVKVHGKKLDLRISTLPIQHGERVVLRILDQSGWHFSINKLGFTEADRQTFESLIRKPHGIILVTGPTGSGKTTTLYASLAHIKSPETNIMTCEDPIEYELEGINQSAVNEKAGLTFANQLRSILRQDPDVVLVGEIRDAETATIAFQAAMTGHLVFSTLHCNDAPSAVTRLVDMGVEPYLIGSSLIGVLAQRLVRQLCPACKEPYEPTEEQIAALGIENLDKGVRFYRAVGCPSCNQRGYSGRIAIFELLPLNESLRRLAVRDPNADVMREEARRMGMKTMRDHGAEKVIAGLTTFEQVVQKVLVEDDD